MNSYLDALTWIDNLIDISTTANLTIVIWLVGKGLYKLWKIVA